MKYKVTHVSRYDFKTDSNEQLQGCKVSYCDETDVLNLPNEKGVSTMIITGDVSLYSRFVQVPGFYELDFRMKAGRGLKPVLQLVDALQVD